MPANKQRMSKWIVEAISLEYEACGQSSPMALRAYSASSMAASKDLLAGESLKEVCDAAGWSSLLTFVRFYDLDAYPGCSCLRLCSPEFTPDRHCLYGGVDINLPIAL